MTRVQKKQILFPELTQLQLEEIPMRLLNWILL